MCWSEVKTALECLSPCFDRLSRKSIHEIEIDVLETGISCLSYRRHCIAGQPRAADAHQFAVVHGLGSETDAGDAFVSQQAKIPLRNRGGVSLHRDFAIGKESE